MQEFEALKDPVRKEVIESVGDKVDWVNSEYTSITWSCIKKVNCNLGIEARIMHRGHNG